jgi:hypothetical protein
MTLDAVRPNQSAGTALIVALRIGEYGIPIRDDIELERQVRIRDSHSVQLGGLAGTSDWTQASKGS